MTKLPERFTESFPRLMVFQPVVRGHLLQIRHCLYGLYSMSHMLHVMQHTTLVWLYLTMLHWINVMVIYPWNQVVCHPLNFAVTGNALLGGICVCCINDVYLRTQLQGNQCDVNKTSDYWLWAVKQKEETKYIQRDNECCLREYVKWIRLHRLHSHCVHAYIQCRFVFGSSKTFC